MLRRILPTFLLGAFLLSDGYAAELRNLIIEVDKARDIGKIEKEYKAHVLGQIGDQPIFLVQVKHSKKLLQKLEKEKRVVRVEEDQLISLDRYPATHSVNQSAMSLFADYSWEEFYGAQVLKQYMDQEALHLIDADDVHDIATGAGAKIAFLDTGVDFDHPALGRWVAPGLDMLGTGSASEFSGIDWSVMSLFWEQLRKFGIDWSVMSLFWEQLQKLGLDWSVMSLFSEDIEAIDLDWSVMSLFWSVMSLFADGDGEEAGVPFSSMFGHGTLVAGLLHAVAPQAVLQKVGQPL